MRQRSGFTVVELLIVVVVIAILAAITVVSYNGISLNSRNTSRISATSTISRSLLLYQAAEGKDALRSLLVGFDQCLGTAYDDVDPGAGVSCRYAEYDHTTATSPVNVALYNEVNKVAKYTINYAPVEQRNFSNVIRIVSSAPFIHHLTTTIVPSRT